MTAKLMRRMLSKLAGMHLQELSRKKMSGID